MNHASLKGKTKGIDVSCKSWPRCPYNEVKQLERREAPRLTRLETETQRSRVRGLSDHMTRILMCSCLEHKRSQIIIVDTLCNINTDSDPILNIIFSINSDITNKVNFYIDIPGWVNHKACARRTENKSKSNSMPSSINKSEENQKIAKWDWHILEIMDLLDTLNNGLICFHKLLL